MANKQRKRFSTPLVIAGMQNKAKMIKHYTSTKILKIKHLTIPNIGRDVKQLELSHIVGENVKETL